MSFRSFAAIVLLISGIVGPLPSQVRCQALFEPSKRAIVRLETPENQLGTGFILTDSVLGYFLVTNRHVISSCSTKSYFDSIFVRKNALTPDGKVVVTQDHATLYLKRSGRPLYVQHPDSSVDLVLVQLGRLRDVDGDFVNPSSFEMIFGFKIASVAARDDYKKLGISDGMPIQIIGFSFQVPQKEQFHVSRFGHISVAPGTAFSLRIALPCGGLPIEQKSNWIVLDLSSRGGDSGGPIFAFEPGSDSAILIGLVTAGSQAEEICFGVPSYRILELVEQTRPLVK